MPNEPVELGPTEVVHPSDGDATLTGPLEEEAFPSMREWLGP